MKVSLLSNETNSKDPLAVHSRIFVGNLNTFQCSKSDVEQIFQRYGHLTAISMHKGYAFVQFSNPVEAKSAADGEDGRLVLNQNIDVNLVSQPKIHQQQQQVTAKHVFQQHQSASASAASSSLKLSATRFQHFLANGAAAAVVAVKPKLSVAIQRRNRKRRRNNQLNRMQPEFLLDSSLLSAGNNQLANQFSGISPTLSSSSSSSASTSSLASIESACSVLSSSAALSTPCFASAAGQGDFQNYRTTVAAANLQSTIPQPQPQQQQHHNQYHPQQWHPGCYLSGLNINNNYLIPTAVYDNPNEVIDGSAGPQQQQLPNPPGVYTEMTSAAAAAAKAPEETQEVVFYDANNNPLSSWQEFILTANKSGPDYGDVLICGNCRELFNDLELLLEHRRTTCQLRVFCECRNTVATTTAFTDTPTTSNTDNTILLCRLCRKQFSRPLALLQHVQHVHQIKIFETEHDYNPDKDLVAHGEQAGESMLAVVDAASEASPGAESTTTEEQSSIASSTSPAPCSIGN